MTGGERHATFTRAPTCDALTSVRPRAVVDTEAGPLSDYSNKDFRQVFGLVSETCVAYYSPLPDPEGSVRSCEVRSHIPLRGQPRIHTGFPYSPEHALRHRKCAQHIGVGTEVSTHI